MGGECEDGSGVLNQVGGTWHRFTGGVVRSWGDYDEGYQMSWFGSAPRLIGAVGVTRHFLEVVACCLEKFGSKIV